MIARLFARRPGDRAPLLRTRLRVEGLEAREVPALWMNYLGDNDGRNLDNWSFGPYEDTSQLRNITFDSACKDDCNGLSGNFDSFTMNPGYKGRVTLEGEMTVAMFYQGNGIIDQPNGSESAITVTQWWGWDGGTLNSTETPSSITVDGSVYGMGMASISPPGAGSLTTGSTIKFNEITATINPGTLNFRLGVEMVVQNNAVVNVPVAYQAVSMFVPAPGQSPVQHSRIRLASNASMIVSGNNNFTQVGQAIWDIPVLNDGGTLRVIQGANLVIRGNEASPDNPENYFGSLLQKSGSTLLQNGGSLEAQSGVQLLSGTLSTLANPVLQPDQQFFIIKGHMRVDGPSGFGPAIYINWELNPQNNHTPGVLKVEGNVRWTSGTYVAYFDGSNPLKADRWEATGTFAINPTGNPGATVSARLYNPPAALANDYAANVLYAAGGLVAAPGQTQAAFPNLTFSNPVFPVKWGHGAVQPGDPQGSKRLCLIPGP